MRVLCLRVCVAIFGSGASGLTPTAQSPDSALQELQTLLASQRSAGELSELVYQAVKRGPSRGDDEGEWRRALEATVVGGRFPREVPIVRKRLTESFERVGDLRNGIRTMHRLEAALAEPSWTQSRQLAYVRARLRRNAGEYVAANLEYVALAEQRPGAHGPPELLHQVRRGGLDPHRKRLAAARGPGAGEERQRCAETAEDGASGRAHRRHDTRSGRR